MNADDRSNDDEGAGKADFSSIYVAPDPRPYCATLAGLGYQIPRHGADVFSRLLGHVPNRLATTRPTVVDICSSYGFVGALCRTTLELDEIYRHYSDAYATSSDEMAAADREFYTTHQRTDAPRVIGVDAAEVAVEYGCRAGLLDAGYGENLEQDPASDELAKAMSEVDLVTTTGGVGYITATTFDALLDARDPAVSPPWVASFVLRMYDYAEIADSLSRHGLITEKLDHQTFVQRRFADGEEQDYAVEQICALGLDPAGKEQDGHYHAELFLSRPAADIEAAPLSTLLTPAG